MDAIEAILTRRSVRRYTDEHVNDEVVNTLLQAGMQAPSANNLQPWHFVVIDDRKILNGIPTFHPYSQMLIDAPLAILVCGDTALEEVPEYISQDCSAAAQNILLAAHALGLGAVWLGIYPTGERVQGIRNLLQIPEQIIPILLISLGYPIPGVEKIKTDRFQPQRVYRNIWGKSIEP